MESKKRYNKLVNISQKKKTKKADTDIVDKLVVSSGEGQNGMGEQGAQAAECKVGSRMYCTTQGI